jgi:hypothetical protein
MAMSKEPVNTNKNCAAGHSRGAAARFSGYLLAFAAGGVATAAGMLFNPSRAESSPLFSHRAAAPSPGAPEPAPRKESKPPQKTPAAQQQDFDPIAEAEKINEINRRNMAGARGMPAGFAAPGRAPHGARPGSPQPPRPAIPRGPGAFGDEAP